MVEEPLGLRERKNARTREAITRAACELILERGFEGATIAQIAERADVAPRTVHTWFASKEEIVLGGLVQPLDRMAAALGGSDGDVLERILRWMEAEGELHVEDLSLLRQRTVARAPHLRGLAMDRLAASEKAISRAVAEDAGVAADSLAAHTYAGALITLLTTLGTRAAEPQLANDPAELDQALALLRGALDALRAHAAH